MFVSPWMQCRHRGKINVKHPATHLDRNILVAVTKPIYLDKPDEAFINRCSVVQREVRQEGEVEQVSGRHIYKYEHVLCCTCILHNNVLMFNINRLTKEREKKVVKLYRSKRDTATFP